MLILAINPGSTSTKIGMFDDETLVFKESVEHDHTEIAKFSTIADQRHMRLEHVLAALKKHGYEPSQLSAVVGRGGLFPPIKTGGYLVNQVMKDMILNDEISPHASNLGAILADGIASQAGLPAYIYDAVSAGSFPDFAEITGFKEIRRQSFCHVLNSRAMALRYAEEHGKKYEHLKLIVAHLGGGISISAHKNGEIIDSLSDDAGPFAPERAGSVPLLDFLDMCFSGNYTKKDMQKKVRGGGGLQSLLGTPDCREIEKRIDDGDEYAATVMKALGYQVAKGIGLLSVTLRGKCDAIILTGGVAKSKLVTDGITSWVSEIADVAVMPGEFELEALAQGALRIVQGKETAHVMEQKN